MHYVFTSKDLSGISIDPDEFHANTGAQKKWAKTCIDSIEFTGKEDVLYIGSADGALSMYAASKVRNGSVLGIDIAQPMVDYASKVYGSRTRNLIFQKADVRDLHLNRQFDIALSTFSTFDWFHDHEQAISNIVRVLKPEGRVYLLVHTNDSIPSLMEQVLTQVASQSKWNWIFCPPGDVFTYSSQRDYERMFRESGCIVTKSDIVTCEYLFENRGELFNWLLPWRQLFQNAPAILSLPDATYRGFIQEVVDAYVQKQRTDDNGRIPYVTHMLQIEAKKNPPLEQQN